MFTTLFISAAFAANIVTCFAPDQNCALLVIGAIEAARSQILVNAYALTTGSGIPGALIRAHDRGVDVRLVADRWSPCELREGITPLAAAGIPVWIDARARMAHEKALIIDRRVTIMGSYNFSAGAARNSEDLNVVTSAEVAGRTRRTGKRGRAGRFCSLMRRNGAGGDDGAPKQH